VQEGHTAHATLDEANVMVYDILELYKQVRTRVNQNLCRRIHLLLLLLLLSKTLPLFPYMLPLPPPYPPSSSLNLHFTLTIPFPSNTSTCCTRLHLFFSFFHACFFFSGSVVLMQGVRGFAGRARDQGRQDGEGEVCGRLLHHHGRGLRCRQRTRHTGEDMEEAVVSDLRNINPVFCLLNAFEVFLTRTFPSYKKYISLSNRNCRYFHRREKKNIIIILF